MSAVTVEETPVERSEVKANVLAVDDVGVLNETGMELYDVKFIVPLEDRVSVAAELLKTTVALGGGLDDIDENDKAG